MVRHVVSSAITCKLTRTVIIELLAFLVLCPPPIQPGNRAVTGLAKITSAFYSGNTHAFPKKLKPT